MDQHHEHLDVNTSIGAQTPSSIDSEDTLGRMRLAVKNNLSREILSMLKSCVHCGLCADACHYYCSTADSGLIPANKIRKLSDMLQTYFHPLRSHLPFSKRQGSPDERMIQELFKTA